MRWSANRAILIVAVILFGIAALLAGRWLQGHSAQTHAQTIVPLLVAIGALAFGAPIGAKGVAQSRPGGAFANFAKLAKNGRRVAIAPFLRDEPLIASKVSAPDQTASLSTVIEKGKRQQWSAGAVKPSRPRRVGRQSSNHLVLGCGGFPDEFKQSNARQRRLGGINRNDCRLSASL
jgi:hypothetical protein